MTDAPSTATAPDQVEATISKADLDRILHAGEGMASLVVQAYKPCAEERDAARDWAVRLEGEQTEALAALGGLLEALNETGWRPTWAKHAEALERAQGVHHDLTRPGRVA